MAVRTGGPAQAQTDPWNRKESRNSPADACAAPTPAGWRCTGGRPRTPGGCHGQKANPVSCLAPHSWWNKGSSVRRRKQRRPPPSRPQAAARTAGPRPDRRATTPLCASRAARPRDADPAGGSPKTPAGPRAQPANPTPPRRSPRQEAERSHTRREREQDKPTTKTRRFHDKGLQMLGRMFNFCIETNAESQRRQVSTRLRAGATLPGLVPSAPAARGPGSRQEGGPGQRRAPPHLSAAPPGGAGRAAAEEPSEASRAGPTLARPRLRPAEGAAGRTQQSKAPAGD